MLDELAREEYEKIFSAIHRHYCVDAADPNLAVALHERRTEALRQYIQMVIPYDDTVSTERSMQSMVDTWKNIWGDPNDPEVKARIELVAKKILSGDAGRS